MSREPRYPSDLSDDEWVLVEPLLPPACTGGRPEKHARRAVVDAVLYVLRTGCPWRRLPADFPPWQTVYWYFVRWERQGVTLRLFDTLLARDCERQEDLGRWSYCQEPERITLS